MGSTRLWPVSFALALGAIDWSGGLGMPPPDASGLSYVVLEGDQCLVFFLGGIPTTGDGSTPGALGFASSPGEPANAERAR